MLNTLFNLNDQINFEVYPTAIYGFRFTNRKVVAVIDHRTAVLYGLDVESTHAAVYPTLPANSTPDDYSKYSYLLLETTTGEREVIGIPWIRPETVERVSSQTIVVHIEAGNGASLETVRQALVANGMRVTHIDVVNSSNVS